MFDLRANLAFEEIGPTPPQVKLQRRPSDPFLRPENERRPAASPPKAQIKNIVASRWRGADPGRIDKSSAPLHQFTERLTAHATHEAHRQKIRSMSHLPEGWDTYSAKPPGKAAINLALQFVTLLEKRRLNPVWIAPTADDSIMVVLDTGAVRQEWEFYGDGDTAVMIQEAGGEKQYLDLDATEFASHLPR